MAPWASLCSRVVYVVHALRAPTDHFEGLSEAKGPVSIFPLSGDGGGQLWPADHLVNWGRLAPPELIKTGRTGSWEVWDVKSLILESERKRRLLHNFIVQKMEPECTIFPYMNYSAFLRKSTCSGIQFRRPHSSL